MLEVYPEALAQLNSDAFNHVLTTVDFGLHQQDVDIIMICMRALKALAFHITTKRQKLATWTYSTDIVSTAADALFPLILCEPNLYQGLGNELVEKQGNSNFRTRLANALQVMTTSNQLSSSLDRLNYQRFRKNLNNFLIEKFVGF
ncbi:hypothetical protein Bca52824_019324 [Brassica carinata]|uniref:Exportin-1 C-terminal domain-containing protein n=1 Tax=Brassica carinata TaxID=52824 RepID=A0A8X7VS93_BRACI|nr:hypothetical protein Bca52824_019324 [Brassica carinata]